MEISATLLLQTLYSISSHPQKRDKKRSLKLAVRTIRFAETLALLSAGHIHASYLSQVEGTLMDALRHYNTALKNNPKNLLAALGLAQIQVKQGKSF